MAGCGARIRQVRQSCFSGISCGNSCDTALGLSDADSCRRRYPEGRGSEFVRAAAGISSVHEKQIRLEDETLNVTETIRNEGGEPADFTWTQHSAFGGSFLDEQVEISYPGEEIFCPHYMPDREEKGRVPQKYLQCADAGRDDMEFEEYERTGTGRTSDLHNEGGDRGFRSVS